MHVVKFALRICPFGQAIPEAGRFPPGQVDLNDPSHEMHFEGVVIHPGPSVERERERERERESWLGTCNS